MNARFHVIKLGLDGTGTYETNPFQLTLKSASNNSIELYIGNYVSYAAAKTAAAALVTASLTWDDTLMVCAKF